MDQTADEIRDAVRRHYASLARGTDQGCGCSSDGCCSGSPASSTLYDPSILTDIPAEASGLSLGCGDPVTLAEIQPGEVVLDLGSGAGLDCFLAARHAGETGRAIGVDMTPEMIERARANQDRLRMPNVEFRLGQLEALPVDDESVDLVISNCVINLVPNKEAALREAFRVLRPGGRLSVSDIVTRGPFPEALRHDAELWSECVTGAIELDEFLSLLTRVGFVDARAPATVSATSMLDLPEGLPEILSARITARKPR